MKLDIRYKCRESKHRCGSYDPVYNEIVVYLKGLTDIIKIVHFQTFPEMVLYRHKPFDEQFTIVFTSLLNHEYLHALIDRFIDTRNNNDNEEEFIVQVENYLILNEH